MNELMKRALFGAIYVAIVLASILFHPFGLLAFSAAVLVIGLTETKHLLKATESKNLFTTATILGVMVLWVHTSFSMDFQNHLIAFYALLIIGVFTHFIFSKGSEKDFNPVVKAIFSVSYIVLPLAFAISIAFVRGFWEPKFLLALFLFIWANDTFAYLTGMALGKHKLIERLSPKKTIEGLVGGLIGSALVGVVLAYFYADLTLWQWVIFAVITAIFGTLGDLFESALKRAANVKDAGNIIPGHGGILDRLDSFFFATPIAYFYLHFFV